jgi:SAM-dependent methyltransferase
MNKKTEIQKESKLMKIFRTIKLDSMAWSLRWLHCPVKKNDLVLEVGSGGSPYFRSNILCDAYLNTGERGFVPLVSDRPTVLAFAEKLPFKSDSFDFVIASHVLEHSEDPDKFLSELQRVAKAGYIEVPDAFMERLTNYKAHRLEISEDKDTLIIKKKTAPITDPELDKLFNKTRSIFPFWLSKYPFNFHIRYYWSKENGGIKYKILNPEYKFDWQYNDSKSGGKAALNLKIKAKGLILNILRKILSQNHRNKNLDIFKYLTCPKCKTGSLSRDNDCTVCKDCGYNICTQNQDIIDFTIQ